MTATAHSRTAQRGRAAAALLVALVLTLPGARTVASDDVSGMVTMHILSGPMRSLVTVANPSGITGVSEYANAGFRQSIVEQTADRVVLEIVSQRVLTTSAPYPVDAASLPAEATEALVARAGWIQSDDPAIMLQAGALALGATTQADVVEAVLAYVRGHVVYDADGPRDAVTVLQTGRAYCVGFSNLTMALLRAAGIPARGVYGCAAPWDGWGSPPQGGRHMWVEVFFPDAGWVASDGQASVNMIDTAHLVGVLDQCGKTGTSITRSEYTGALSAQDPGLVGSVTTSFPSASGLPLYAASVTPPEVAGLVVSPAEWTLELTPETPQQMLTVNVTSLDTSAAGWTLESHAAWLIPVSDAGTLPGTATVQVDGRTLAAGTHVGTLQITAAPASPGAAPGTLTVTMHMSPERIPPEPADQPYRVPIPIVLRLAGS